MRAKQTPEERRAKRRLYDATPERRAARALRAKSPKTREQQRRYGISPRRREARRLNYATPDVCAAQRKAVRDRCVKRRQRMNVLKDNPCTDCGGRFPPECMDFDHIRGEKYKAVGQLFARSVRRLTAEIAKCELVCANCHRTRTWLRRLV